MINVYKHNNFIISIFIYQLKKNKTQREKKLKEKRI